MRIVFVHPNYPAQFGHVAQQLSARHGDQCWFVTHRGSGQDGPVERIGYQIGGGARAENHYCSRSFENYVWHSHGVYEALKARPDIQPDLVVGHSGFGSTVFLRELYACPIINYFEFYYHAHGSDLDYRPEFPPTELDVLRTYTRDAMLLLDLETCTAGYCPTEYQRSLFPPVYQPKLSCIFDGLDPQFWRRLSAAELGPRQVAGQTIGDDQKIVTYVSRGFESMRGFDIFMQIAGRMAQERDDVVFVCVGTDRVAYGGDLRYVEAKSFREHVLSQSNYPLERFIFTGRVAPQELVRIFSLSDLHIYLTVPFVLSWSLMNALSCECTVVASDTPPVQEMITHGENGLLADFFDVDRLTELALDVLAAPQNFSQLGPAGRQRIEDRYSTERVLPHLRAFYEQVAAAAE